MIADSSILSTSPWNSDPLFSRDMLTDLLRPYCTTSLDDFQPLGSTSQSRASSAKSTSSSDCGDNNENGSQEGSLFSWADNEILEMSTILEDNANFTDIPLCDFEWNISENHSSDTPNLNSAVASVSCSPQIVRKQRKVLDPFAETKSWSELKAEEQLEIVEALTQVISCELGIREQLEVIRIIEPNAVISPTDTEFVIDLNSLDNFKWAQVKECVKKARTNVRLHKANQEKENGRSEAGTSNLRRNEENHQNSSKIKRSKKDVKDKKLQLKAWKQRQKKEQRQMMKEKRSGLFIHEEVLALKTIPTIEEDIDIDILE